MPRSREENRLYMQRYRARQKRNRGNTVDLAPVLPLNSHKNVGDVLAKWATATLRVPTGPLAGQPFKLGKWQTDFLNQVFSQEQFVREGVLCVARKNGKTGLIAALTLAYLAGPLNRPQWRCVVCSVKAELAKELRHQIMDIATASGIDGLELRVSPTPGHVLGQNGTRVDFLAADKSSGHAVGADLALVDELGLLEERNRGLVNALFTSISGRNGKFLGISIMGHGPFIPEIRDRSDLHSVIYHEYAATNTEKLDDVEQWHKANPGLTDGIKSVDYMRDAAIRASRSPSNTNDFLAFDLNLPREPEREPFCTPPQWARCVVVEMPPRHGPAYVGIDLGGSSSMTASAVYWPKSGRLEAWGAFPDIPPIEERARTDQVGDAYKRMMREQALWALPGRTTPVEQFLEKLLEELQGYPVAAFAADRYRQSEAMQAIEQAGLSWRADWRGQGFLDGSEDVRNAKKMLLNRKLAVQRSTLIEHAISESSIIYDPAGNPKLDKARHRGRIDALSAVVLALSLGHRATAGRQRQTRYVGAV